MPGEPKEGQNQEENSPVEDKPEINEEHEFLDPRRVISELMSETTQLNNALTHALGNDTDFGIEYVIQFFKEEEQTENISSGLTLLQEKLSQVKEIRKSFESIGPKNADVNELTRAVDKIHDIRKEIATILKNIDRPEQFKDKRIQWFIDAANKKMRNRSILDPLRLALSNSEDEPSVSLSDKISEEIRDFTEPYLKPESEDDPGFSETRLLGALAGIAIEPKSDSAKFNIGRESRFSEKVLDWLQSQKQTDQITAVDTLLRERGFILEINPFDEKISEESFSLLQDEIRRIFIDEAVIKNLNINHPEQSLDAFLKITIEDTDQGAILVLRYPVDSQCAQQIVEESHQEILKNGKSRTGGAPSFQLFLTRLAYDRRKRIFRTASIEETLDSGKQVIAERVSII